MVRIGDWKIVRVNAESWELFDLRVDPTELVNFATKNPEKLASMVTASIGSKKNRRCCLDSRK